MSAEHKLCSSSEVAQRFRVHSETVRRWADAGKLPVAARTVGGHRRFRIEDIEALERATLDAEAEA